MMPPKVIDYIDQTELPNHIHRLHAWNDLQNIGKMVIYIWWTMCKKEAAHNIDEQVPLSK